MKSNLAGQIFGNYKLLRMIGEGGMGSVYEAEEKGIGRKVAVKILPRALAQNPNYMERFNREVKTAASLEHIHITPIYAYGEHEGMSYVVMRLLTGGDLQKRLQKLGRPSLLESKKLLEQIASALDYAHGRGVIHRDLKPSNIMFDEQGNAYLADFGIAKVVGEVGLTGTGQAIGTPTYMPPEQWVGKMVDARSDIYAFAAMTYQLLSGQTPFAADTPHVMMFKHLNETPTPVHVVQPALSLEVTQVLMRGMAKDPQHRYASAGEFVRALMAAMTYLPPNETLHTGFMTTRLETDSAAHYRTPTGATNPSRTPLQRSATSTRPRNNNGLLWGGLSLLVMGIIIVGVLFALQDSGSSGGNEVAVATLSERELAQATFDAVASQTGVALDEENRQATIQGVGTQIAQEATQTQVALNPTATPIPFTMTPLPTATLRPTQKPSPTATTEKAILEVLGGVAFYPEPQDSMLWTLVTDGSYLIMSISPNKDFYGVTDAGKIWWVKVDSANIRVVGGLNDAAEDMALLEVIGSVAFRDEPSSSALWVLVKDGMYEIVRRSPNGDFYGVNYEGELRWVDVNHPNIRVQN